MSNPLSKLLSQTLIENGYQLPAEQEQRLLRFLELLQEWNRVFNLTSLEKPEDLVKLHILDSLTILPYLRGQRCLDIGSGGGLPGLPLAIVDPSKQWVLLDKVEKKTRFLVQVAAELGLKNVQVACSRIEDFKAGEGFDSIVSRAFGTIALLIQGSQRLLNPGGCFLAMKGLYPTDEIKEIPADYKVVSVPELSIEGLDAKRHVVIIEHGSN